MPAFPKPDPLDVVVSRSIRLTRRMWARLAKIAKDEKKSRTKVVAFFLEWASDDYDREHHRK